MTKNVLFGDVRLCLDGSYLAKNDSWQAALVPYNYIDGEMEPLETYELTYFSAKEIALAAVFYIDTINKYSPLKNRPKYCCTIN